MPDLITLADALRDELMRLRDLSACQEDIDSIDALVSAYDAERAKEAQAWEAHAVLASDGVFFGAYPTNEKSYADSVSEFLEGTTLPVRITRKEQP